MAINMKKTPPTIEINGARYALHMSDNDVLALCREARRRVMNIHIGAEDGALSSLTISGTVLLGRSKKADVTL